MTDIKTLAKLLDEGVEAVIQKKSAEELLDSIAETAKENLDMAPADFKARVNTMYQRIYEQEKYEKKREKVESLYEDLDAVEGV